MTQLGVAQLGVGFLGVGLHKLLPFGVHVWGVVSQLIMFESTLSKAKLLHELAHLFVGKNLPQLFVGQLLGVFL
ncbi:MAG: hypothetical protein IJK15_10035 [Bacteroidaceae bacterium]|nr:hypothetical protein [Bacteroidaceae bacterium]